MGIYIIDEPNKTYSATDNTLTISGLDLMARLNGQRNGNLEGMQYVIPSNSNIRETLIGTLSMAGFTNVDCEDCVDSDGDLVNVPNDIVISVGGTYYDIIKELVDIYPSYQAYFDVNGVFHYNKIPDGHNEQIMVDDDYGKMF